MVARPFASEVTEACDIPRMIGIGSLVIVVSPPVTIGESLLVRPSSDSVAAICVCDSGIGIPLEEQPKIFERFYRVDKARSRDLKGAGIGLAIAQWIVQQHAGSITVQSLPGEGSTFVVELPLQAAQLGVAESSPAVYAR